MAEKDTKLATATERIILHLIEFKSYADEIDGPMELSQIGVAEAIGVARGNITRAILPLMEDGLVESHKVHVPGIRLKRNIYYLTGQGLKEAKLIKKNMKKAHVEIVDKDGNITNTTLGEAMESIPYDIRFIDILREVNKLKIFDCKAYLKKQNQTGIYSPDFLKEKAKLTHFYGRQKEVKLASKWMNSRASHTLILKGMPGIGKTSLVAKIIDENKSKMKVHFFSIQPWCSVRAILISLANYCEEMGKVELSSYLRENKSIDFSEIEYLLTECISEISTGLIVFDNYHNSNDNIDNLFKMLNQIISKSDKMKLIVSGRSIKPFYERKDIADKKVLEITLDGLDKEGTMELAREIGASEDQLEMIYSQTQGHPLFVELLGTGGASEINIDLERFINEELTKNLTENDLELLKYLSVHRYPVNRKGLHGYQLVLTNLIDNSIIQQSDEGFIGIHDLIKSAIYRQLAREDVIKLHSKAAEYYLESFTMDSLMEVLYHLLNAQRYDDACDIILDKQEKLLKSDRLEELARILTLLLGKFFDIEKQEKAKLLYMQGKALAFIGEWDDAIMHYNRAMVLASEDEMLEMKSKSGIAEISLMRNNYSIAQAHFEDVLEWADKNNCVELKTEASYQLGTGHERQGHNDQALKYFNESLKYSFRTHDRHQMAKAYYGQGRIYHRNQKYETSLESKKRALDIALKIGNKQIASKILTSIGNTLDRMELLEEEIETHERAIVLARESGAIRTLAYALSNAGAAYLDKFKLDLSQKCLDEASIIFENLGENYMSATTYLNKAIIALYKEDMDRAIYLFNECKNLLNMIENKEKLMESYYRFGLALKKSKYLDEANTFFNEALTISKKLGDNAAPRQIIEEINKLRR